MSQFQHSICAECWALGQDGRIPVRLKDAPEEICCFCAAPHRSGIYVREDPEKVLCQGKHQGEDD